MFHILYTLDACIALLNLYISIEFCHVISRICVSKFGVLYLVYCIWCIVFGVLMYKCIVCYNVHDEYKKTTMKWTLNKHMTYDISQATMSLVWVFTKFMVEFKNLINFVICDSNQLDRQTDRQKCDTLDIHLICSQLQ